MKMQFATCVKRDLGYYQGSQGLFLIQNYLKSLNLGDPLIIDFI